MGKPTEYIRNGVMTPNAINAAACEFVGANPKTGYPYMGKMKNPINGFLKIEKHPTGQKVLMFRKVEYYSMSEKEITALHPKTGQKTVDLFLRKV